MFTVYSVVSPGKRTSCASEASSPVKKEGKEARGCHLGVDALRGRQRHPSTGGLSKGFPEISSEPTPGASVSSRRRRGGMQAEGTSRNESERPSKEKEATLWPVQASYPVLLFTCGWELLWAGRQAEKGPA